MPFYSAGDGDLKTAFVSDAWLLDQFVGNTLFCWGRNTYGQIGDNSTINKSNPVQTVAQGNNWKQISGNGYGACGIKTDGTLWTWGYNANEGINGDNTNLNRSSPVQTVAFGTNWKSCFGGNFHTAAIKTDGTLWLWGRNYAGHLGDNTVTKRSSPVQTIALGTNWKQVSVGFYHSAAIKTDGTLWVWGKNSYGQLGDNTITDRSSPVQTIALGTNWKQVDCAFGHTAAIKTDGTLWMWGNNGSGQLGDNTTTKKSSPIQTIAYGTNWKQVSCGISHIGATKTDGTLWMWGNNGSGQLGDNTVIDRSSPVQTISFGNNWKQVSAGKDLTIKTTAAIKTDGTLWCWGVGTSGQLGDNTATSKSSPVQTSTSGTNWKQVSCAGGSTYAVKNGDL